MIPANYIPNRDARIVSDTTGIPDDMQELRTERQFLLAIEDGDEGTVISILGTYPHFLHVPIGGAPALSAAAMQSQHSIAELFLRRGADVNARGLRGKTALREACRWSDLAMVKLLCDHGADVNAVENDGFPVLFTAYNESTPESVEIVRLLLEKGADPNYPLPYATPVRMLKDIRGRYMDDVEQVFVEFGAIE